MRSRAVSRDAPARSLYASDAVLLGLMGVLALVALVFARRVQAWWWLVPAYAAGAAGIVGLAWAHARSRSRAIAFVHDWYLAPFTFLVFRSLHALVGPVHGWHVVDERLIAADRWLFGADPTRWLAQFARPWLTELLQAAYTSFYFLFLVVGAELYAEPGRARYRRWLFICASGFGASYLAYFLAPAVGPRFTLYEFSRVDLELPGLWLTPYLRWFVDVGGSVPLGVPGAVAMLHAQRDVFPSGHTMMTLVAMYWSARWRLRVRWFIHAVGALVIAGTLYLRYHYAVDLVAGAALAAACVAVTDRVYAWVVARFGTADRLA